MAKTQPTPDTEAIQGLTDATASFAGLPTSGDLEQSRQALLDAGVDQDVIDLFYPTEESKALTAVKKSEATTTATRRLMSILEAANIDFNNPLTQGMLSAISGGQSGEEAAQAALAILTGPGGDLALNYFLEHNPDAAIVQATPYSVALADNNFSTSLSPQELGEAQQKAGMSGIPPSQFPTTATTGDYEYSESTGAIRYGNGTIVTSDGGIIFDPTKNAPGSQGYLRDASTSWDEAKIAEWKRKLVQYGYLSKDDAKAPGFTVQLRGALETYWSNYYINGGKPISAESGGSSGSQTPLIDYADFSAQIQNDTRDQLRRVLGTEPTEEQVRAQAQYIMRTATDLQKKFRGKDYGSPGSMALTEATERAIGNIETSPYAQDVRENTTLHDSMQNAAAVSRSLMS